MHKTRLFKRKNRKIYWGGGLFPTSHIGRIDAACVTESVWRLCSNSDRVPGRCVTPVISAKKFVIDIFLMTSERSGTTHSAASAVLISLRPRKTPRQTLLYIIQTCAREYTRTNARISCIQVVQKVRPPRNNQ